MEQMNRREALRRIGQTTAGLALTPAVIRGQGGDIMIAGRPVEIAVAAVSPSTVRITVLPIDAGKVGSIPETGTVVAAQGKVSGRGRTASALTAVRTGDMRVRFTADPP